MAQITLTIPDASLPRIMTAFCTEFGYDPTSGLTQGQFTKQQVIEYVKQVTRNYEGRLAAAADIQAKATEINAINIT